MGRHGTGASTGEWTRMKIQPKTMVQFQMIGEAETHSRTLLSTRELVDVSDEPEARGGSNEGFAPTEFQDPRSIIGFHGPGSTSILHWL